MRFSQFALLLIILCAENVSAAERTPINVGVAHRIPYLMEGNTGLAVSFIHAMNQIQQEYEFNLVGFPNQRKQQSLKNGWIDIVMWDNLAWGWHDFELKASRPLIKAKDIYVTLNINGRDQSYFKRLAERKLAVTRGFHYRFADFETNYEALTNRFDIEMVRNESDTIRMVLDNRVDIAVTNNVTLNWHIKRFPRHKEMLLISNVIDTEFERFALIPEGAPISVSQFNEILSLLEKDKLLEIVYENYGLIPPSFN